ncbi:MAG: HAD-IA family hydrolase [Tissierellia bacterium]|jgi:pyrophosphatase PpaX|nr:HAD-IA family hydrolase [Tissierellia bacterium]MDD3226658.1 HAD-IA family hydrolase [Tissierellia bacterium]MDD3751306.1 HAD-IA family hydrolase [Tissierellia bacterium]MDD4046615.1 HAD-IA family hydrolase [Tissierellia bacterium]MDD4678130.1 HAD-IA family hydrolase [Tissierellia bacterium]
MIDTVIFDFDGTLADTNKLILNSFNHIYNKYHDRKCDEDYILSTFGEPLELTLRRDFGDYSYEEVVGCYRGYQVDKFDKEVTLYDTVIETIKYLHNKNIKLGIATSRLKSSTLYVLKRFNLEKYFQVVISSDDVVKHKPDKEPLIKAIQGLNSTTENTLYVGDSKFDMECAINAEVTPVLVGWQKHSNELAEKYNIKHVLNKMWDLTEIL